MLALLQLPYGAENGVAFSGWVTVAEQSVVQPADCLSKLTNVGVILRLAR
jgi:hypothetical protein